MTLSSLELIFRKLRSRGIVRSIRGSHGGFLLARPSEEMTIADVVLAMEESLFETAQACTCPHPWRRDADVAFDMLLVGLNNHLIDSLRTVSIKDIVDPQTVRGAQINGSSHD